MNVHELVEKLYYIAKHNDSTDGMKAVEALLTEALEWTCELHNETQSGNCHGCIQGGYTAGIDKERNEIVKYVESRKGIPEHHSDLAAQIRARGEAK